MGARVTERRAALAARQLLYHRERLGWMEERMGENAALLESFLALAGEDETVLPGDYVLVREEGSGTPVGVRRTAAGGGFEQLRLGAAKVRRGSPRLRRISQRTSLARTGGAIPRVALRDVTRRKQERSYDRAVPDVFAGSARCIGRSGWCVPREEEEAGLSGEGLGIYALLSRLGFPKTYLGKVMLVVFSVAQAPPIALALYLLIAPPGSPGEHPGVLAALLFAALLVGFFATAWALRALLAPVRLASASLKGYLEAGARPELPGGFPDEAGALMADAGHLIERADDTIRMLEGLSGTDHLTGLPNRREGEERLSEDLARARRGGGVLTVVVVDVNRFKRINDAFGHEAGDACIRHVAGAMRRNIREGDWVARWGGDEFVLGLWDASLFAQTEAVLRRIGGALREDPLRLPGGEELALSVSAGACRYSGEDDPRELLSKADAAMYEAKREGRAWVLAR